MSDDGETRDEYLDRINRALARPDAQEFMQVQNLGADLGTVKVGYRLIGGDFLAECKVRKPGAKRSRRLWATGAGRAEALENLATLVAAYFYPVAKP